MTRINYMNFKIIFFLNSVLLFILLTILGTISHELGHILAANFLGYDTTLHYNSMSWQKDGLNAENIAPLIDNIIVTFSGIFQTIFTGSVGVFLIHLKNKKMFWLGVYLSFFWSREIINLLMQILNSLINKTKIFNGVGDEVLLSKMLNLQHGFFSIFLGLIGIVVCFYVVFFKMKDAYRFSFIVSGLLGSFLGYYLWFVKFGSLILP